MAEVPFTRTKSISTRSISNVTGVVCAAEKVCTVSRANPGQLAVSAVTSILAWPLVRVIAESAVAVPGVVASKAVLSSLHLAGSKAVPEKSSVSNTCGKATTSTFSGPATAAAGVLDAPKTVEPSPTGVILNVCVSGPPAGKLSVNEPFTAPAGTATL